MADVTDAMLRFLTGMGTVKAFNCEQFELDNFNKHNDDLFKIAAKQMRVSCRERPLTSLTSKLGIFLVIFVGGNMVLTNELQFDNIVLFIAALSFMYAPGKELSQLNAQLQAHLPGAESVFEILDEEWKIHEGEIIKESFDNEIEFKNVNFAYNVDNPVLNDFSLKIKKGQTIGLVGAAGAGKSTIINLVLRLFDIDNGSIAFDGVDIKDLTFESPRDQLALVGQSPFLFSSTVVENIAYGHGNISMERIIDAAKAANIYNEIMKLDKRYEQKVRERGDNFSGGQKQRLSIARAICKNAPILLLDEATSALDSINEKQVQESLDKLMEGPTTIVVAHRLATVKNADKIIIMKGGYIVGEGAHDELVDNCPEYAELVALQGLR